MADNQNLSGCSKLNEFVLLIMLTMGRFSLFLICFIIWVQVIGQQSRTIQVQPISSENNLSQNYIRCIFQDNKGYLWFGTFDGLNRYNGKKFEHYFNNSDDSLSIPHNDIRTIYQDKKDRLWIGTKNGLCVYNGSNNNFINLNHLVNNKLLLSHNEIRAIFIDDNEILWVGTYGGGIDRVDLKNKKIINIKANNGDASSILSNVINCFYVENNKKIWVGTENGGLSLLNLENQKVINFIQDTSASSVLSKGVINCIIADNIDTNILWIGTWNNGLLRFKKDDYTFKRYVNVPNNANSLSNNTVRAIEQDKKGNLWLSTFGGGVNLFNADSEEFTVFTNNPSDPTSITYNLLWSSLIDKSGILWLGTFGGGVNKTIINNIGIIHLKSSTNNHNKLNNNAISAICVDHNQQIWLGTIGGGIYVYDFKNQQYRNKLKGLQPGVVVRDIFEDKLHRVWIATENGLYRFESEKKTVSFYSQQLIDKPIYCIYEDSYNDIWLGTFDEGLFKLSRKESLKNDAVDAKFEHYSNNPADSNSLSSNRIWTIYEDTEGCLWFGTFSSLEKFDRENNQFIHFKTNINSTSIINQFQVNTIFEGNNSTLWLATSGGGLVSFNKHTHKMVYHNSPKNIYGILEDKHSNIWLSTNEQGICKYIPETDQYRPYSSLDGFQGDVFERKAFGKLNNGCFIFGGTNGADIFHPDSLIDNGYNPPVVITDFKLFNQSVTKLRNDKRFQTHFSELKQIKLSHTENFFSIEFSSLNYLSPKKTNYAYKLEGFNNDWIYTDANNNSATYTNLDGGMYNFIVKASATNNFNNSNAVELTIEVLPPIWKTWWFRFLAGIFVITLIILIVQRRIQGFKKQKAELEKLVKIKTLELQKQKEALEVSNNELQNQKTEIMSQRDHLQEMSQQVEEANQRKIKFFTNISHELRTPLTLLLSPINRILQNSGFNNQIQTDLKLVQRNAQRLHKLVNQLMDFRKIETGTMPLSIAENDILTFIKNIRDTFIDIADQYEINYVFNNDTVSYNCWFDADKIEKIIYNLLSNAFKYTPKGGSISLKVTVYNDITRLESFVKYLQNKDILPLGDAIVIELSDTGKGIAKDRQDKIFNRFYQIENAGAGFHESTGIGLALTKDLVEVHRGTISVISELNQGSTFQVILPVSKLFYIENGMIEFIQNTHTNPIVNTKLIPHDYVKENITLPQTFSFDDTSKTSILIVDDHSDMRAFLKSCFDDIYNVLEAENGEVGIRLAQKYQPAIIISDIMMPVMGGDEMCMVLKQNIETSHIPILLLTAKSLPEHKIEGLQTGADDYITKPFELDVLVLKVRNIIETRNKLKRSYLFEANITHSDIVTTPIDEEFITKAINIIQKNITDKDFNVDTFTQEMAMGRTLFYQKIKRLTNQSVNEFIQTVKLKKAVELMKLGNLRVSEICYETGFSSPRYFSTCFKKQFGKTPTEYIDEINAS